MSNSISGYNARQLGFSADITKLNQALKENGLHMVAVENKSPKGYLAAITPLTDKNKNPFTNGTVGVCSTNVQGTRGIDSSVTGFGETPQEAMNRVAEQFPNEGIILQRKYYPEKDAFTKKIPYKL
jgi:hypothetical protein